MELNIINTQIKNFITGHFPLARNVRDDDRLLSNGILDSMGILEVVAFIEEEFHITVSDEELLPENFESLSELTTFVQSKLTLASPA